MLTYSAPWTPTIAGARLLTARVTDAQTQTVLSPKVTVNVLTPQEMPQLSFATAGRYYVGRGFVDLYADARPPSGSTIQKIEYLNGTTVIATRTAPPYNLTWVAEQGSHSLSARAVDSLGRVTTSEQVTVLVAPELELTIAAGIDGSTVAARSITVTGSIKAPPNSAIEVNGKFGSISADGSFVIADIPLRLGSNTLVVNLRTVDAHLKSIAATVTSNGPGTFEFKALSASGFHRHSTAFTLTALAATPFTRVELRCYEGGEISATVSTVGELGQTSCLYPNPGRHIASVKVFDRTTLIFEGKQYIQVVSVLENSRSALGAFSGLMARLGDGKVDLALSSIAMDYRSGYGDMFTHLGTGLAAAVEQFGQTGTVTVTSETAEIVILRGESGAKSAFLINVMLCADGIWRVVSM